MWNSVFHRLVWKLVHVCIMPRRTKKSVGATGSSQKRLWHFEFRGHIGCFCVLFLSRHVTMAWRGLEITNLSHSRSNQFQSYITVTKSTTLRTYIPHIRILIKKPPSSYRKWLVFCMCYILMYSSWNIDPIHIKISSLVNFLCLFEQNSQFPACTSWD